MLGQFIHAHRGQIYELNSVFHLFGTTQKENQTADVHQKLGVNGYSSTDLMLWEFGNEIFHNTAKPPWK